MGIATRYEGQLYRVLAADDHPGQGRMTGSNHARLRNLSTGTLWEHSFRSELKLDDIPMDKRALEFLESGMRLAVEFLEGRPVNVVSPGHVEVRIADTAPASHQQQDSNFKPAKLKTGSDVMVPQFVKSGDMIHIDVETLKYVDRVKRSG